MLILSDVLIIYIKTRNSCMPLRVNSYKLILTFIILILCTSLVTGQDSPGLSFLRIGVGGRESALGGAVTAFAQGPLAAYWNPAGLNFSKGRELSFSYTDWLLDINTHFAGYVFKRGSGTFGISFYSVGVDGIEIRTKPTETPDGITGSHNIFVGCSYARILRDNLYFGTTLKYLYEKIYIESASGWGIDAGLQYIHPRDGVQAGLTIQNLGQMSPLKTEKSEMPGRIKIGAGYKKSVLDNKLMVTVLSDYEFNFHFNNYLLSGLEIGYNDLITVRSGYVFDSPTRDFSWGLGFKFRDNNFDYCYLPFTNGFGETHRFTIGLSF